MEVGKEESGFTVIEVVVALIVMSVFLTLLFQLYMATQSQHLSAVQHAVANDIAQSNLRKINTRASIPASTPACAPGVTQIIASNESGSHPKWTGDGTPSSGLAKESLSNTSLPSTGVVQKLTVNYPRGCDPAMPARITSTVEYGTETVVRATYVN